MHQKVFLHSNIFLLLSILFITYVDISTAQTGTPSSTGSQSSPSSTSTRPPKTKKTERKPYSGDNQYDNYGNDDQYYKNDNYGGYDKNDNYGGYNYGDSGMSGDNGIDPRPYGRDMADRGRIYDNQEPMIESLNLWITNEDDWEEKGKSKYRGKGRGNYGGKKDYKKKKDYNKKKDYKGKNNNYNDDDDDYKMDGNRKKRSYSKVRFPVRHYPNIRRFPIRRFPSLIGTLPWLPIFYDEITYQTFIFSPTGGMYILPPLINFYGKRFAVAQLIKWGYASLVSTGVPPPPNVNVAPLVQPPPPAPAGGAPAVPGPAFDANKAQFTDGVRTQFDSFKPRHAQYEQDGYRNNRNPDSNYGGTGQQQVYAQGDNQRMGSGGR